MVYLAVQCIATGLLLILGIVAVLGFYAILGLIWTGGL